MKGNGRAQFDVLVVGAGVIGLACAWRAARRGLRVCVLERDGAAAGASGVAAGMLAPVGEAAWGEEDLLSLNLLSLRRWRAFAAELTEETGLEFGYRPLGALHVALDRDEAEALRRRRRLHAELGLASEWLRPSACRRLEPGLATAVAGGLHARDEAVVDPRRLCAALVHALERREVALELGAEVVEAELGAERSTLRCGDRREFSAARVVAAAGCWSGSAAWLPQELRPPVRPVKGEVLVLRGSADRPACERIVHGERVYMVPREDGRLVVGATVEERGFDTTVSAGGVHELLREAYRALPEIAELELEETRAGLRPATPDNAPLIGPARAGGLFFATGHFRNGVLQAPATADAVASLLAGDEPELDLTRFAPGRFGAGRAQTATAEAEVGGR